MIRQEAYEKYLREYSDLKEAEAKDAHEEVKRLKAENKKLLRAVGILEGTICRIHPRYKGVHPPQVECKACHKVYKKKQK